MKSFRQIVPGTNPPWNRPSMVSPALILFMVLVTTATSQGQDATETTITLHWTAPGDDGMIGQATAYDIRYATEMITESNWGAANQVDGEPSPQIAGSQESFIVTGLDPGSSYYFGVKTVDDASNWSEMSNIVMRTTLEEEIPPANIADLNVVSATPTSVTLSWTAPGDDAATGTAAEYDIRYSISLINNQNWDLASQLDGEPKPQAAGSSESFTVSDLEPGITYYFAIKTADEVPNWSGLSNVVGGSTIDNIPPAAIDDLTYLPSSMIHFTLAFGLIPREASMLY